MRPEGVPKWILTPRRVLTSRLQTVDLVDVARWSAQECPPHVAAQLASASKLEGRGLQRGWTGHECCYFITLALNLWPKAALGPSPVFLISFTSEGLTSFRHLLGSQWGSLTRPGEEPYPT